MTSPLLNSQIVFVYKLFEIYQQVAFAFSKNIWVLFKLSIYLKIINNLFCIILLSHNIFPLNSRVLLFSSSFFFGRRFETSLTLIYLCLSCIFFSKQARLSFLPAFFYSTSSSCAFSFLSIFFHHLLFFSSSFSFPSHKLTFHRSCVFF